jgi:uncharacterized protein (DUF433 family)
MNTQSGDDGSGIRKRILQAWADGMTHSQIADAFGLKPKFVMEVLKEEQKKIVEHWESGFEKGA